MSALAWLPLYKAKISLPVDRRELLLGLRRKVELAEPSALWRMPSVLPYFGEVNDSYFLLRPVGFVVDALRPVIDGTVAERQGGCTVAFRVRPSWPVACAVTAWMLLFLSFDAAVMVQEWNAGRPLRLAGLLPVAVALLVYIVWVRTVVTAGRRFDALLPLLTAGGSQAENR
jgi:hypothetical protein